MSDLLRARDVADMLSVSVRTVWKLVEEGRLQATKISTRCTRFRPADVSAMVDSYDPRCSSLCSYCEDPAVAKVLVMLGPQAHWQEQLWCADHLVTEAEQVRDNPAFYTGDEVPA